IRAALLPAFDQGMVFLVLTNELAEGVVNGALVAQFLAQARADQGFVIISPLTTAQRRPGKSDNLFPLPRGNAHLCQLGANFAGQREALPLGPADHGLRRRLQFSRGYGHRILSSELATRFRRESLGQLDLLARCADFQKSCGCYAMQINRATEPP